MINSLRRLVKRRANILLSLSSILILAVLLFFVLWKIPQWQGESYRTRLTAAGLSDLEPKERVQIEKELIVNENTARTTLAQILGGSVLLAGLYFTWRNVKIADEGKITERFGKAIEFLGSEKLDIRLGGIYALERIARDSQKDHWTIMEILTAYTREHSKTENIANTKILPTDIQAVLTVIGRRKWHNRELSGQRIDLSGANLAGLDLRNLILSRANLDGADLSAADLRGTDLSGAYLAGANLVMSDLRKAKFLDTNLQKADLRFANLEATKLSHVDLREADLSGANCKYSDFSGANLAMTSFSIAHQSIKGFRGLNLTPRNLKTVSFSKVHFSVADLAKIDKTKENITIATFDFTEVRKAIINKEQSIPAIACPANLTGTDFTGASLYRSDLRGAILIFANFQNADIREAMVTVANFERANLAGAKLFKTDFTETAGLTREQIAKADATLAILPPNLKV
ncbi:MAG: pentapeptide repeat-containing protein [Blastocatellia bacterium]